MIDMNDLEEVTRKLEELNNLNLPHMTVESLASNNKEFASIIKNALPEEIDEIQKYLYEFLDDTDKKEHVCIFTDKSPRLQWGLVHGVAIDDNTGLSWKVYHYFKAKGKENRFEKTMQYHPHVYKLQ